MWDHNNCSHKLSWCKPFIGTLVVGLWSRHESRCWPGKCHKTHKLSHKCKKLQRRWVPKHSQMIITLRVEILRCSKFLGQKCRWQTLSKKMFFIPWENSWSMNIKSRPTSPFGDLKCKLWSNFFVNLILYH